MNSHDSRMTEFLFQFSRVMLLDIKRGRSGGDGGDVMVLVMVLVMVGMRMMVLHGGGNGGVVVMKMMVFNGEWRVVVSARKDGVNGGDGGGNDGDSDGDDGGDDNGCRGDGVNDDGNM